MTFEFAPATQNEAWGFYGTMTQRGIDANAAWEIAAREIAKATSCDLAETGAFLDSRQGRHFADTVSDRTDLKTAIANAVTEWMGWRISRTECRNRHPGRAPKPHRVRLRRSLYRIGAAK